MRDLGAIGQLTVANGLLGGARWSAALATFLLSSAAGATSLMPASWTQDSVPSEASQVVDQAGATCERTYGLPDGTKVTATDFSMGGSPSTVVRVAKSVKPDGTVVWDVHRPETPGHPSTFLVYHVHPDGTGTRYEQVDDQPSTTRPVQPTDFVKPTTPRTETGGGTPTEQPKTPTPQTTGDHTEPKRNLKVVNYGGPPPSTTIHFDPGSPVTPDDFVRNPQPQNTWKPDDGEGPKTGTIPDGFGTIPVWPGNGPKQPGNPGQPGNGQPGGGQPGGGTPTGGGGGTPTGGGGNCSYNIGFDWSYGHVPCDFVNQCSTPQTDFAVTPEQDRARTIALARAHEAEPPPPVVVPEKPWDGKYDPTGESAHMQLVRQDKANALKEAAQLTQERANSCLPNDAWDMLQFGRGDPIRHAEDLALRRQWEIDIYEETYKRIRSKGYDNLAAHIGAQQAVDDWNEQARRDFMNMMITHLQLLGNAIMAQQVMKELAENLGEILKAKDATRQRQLFDQAVQQAKAKANSAPEESAGGSTERYGAGEGPKGGKQATGEEPTQCEAPPQPDPANQKAAQEYNQTMERIRQRDPQMNERLRKLWRDKAYAGGDEGNFEPPISSKDKLTSEQRAQIETEVEALQEADIKDTNRAIELSNQLNPRPAGPPAEVGNQPGMNKSQLDDFLNGRPPVNTESPTQMNPHTGPGQTQVLPPGR